MRVQILMEIICLDQISGSAAKRCLNIAAQAYLLGVHRFNMLGRMA